MPHQTASAPVRRSYYKTRGRSQWPRTARYIVGIGYSYDGELITEFSSWKAMLRRWDSQPEADAPPAQNQRTLCENLIQKFSPLPGFEKFLSAHCITACGISLSIYQLPWPPSTCITTFTRIVLN